MTSDSQTVSDPVTSLLLQDLPLVVFLRHINQQRRVLPKAKLQDEGASIRLNHCMKDSCPGEWSRPMVDLARTRNKLLFYCHGDSGGCLSLQHNRAYTDCLWQFGTSAHGWPEAGGRKGGDTAYVRCFCSHAIQWAHLVHWKRGWKPWLANQTLSVFVKTVLLECSHAHSLMYCLRLLQCYREEPSHFSTDLRPIKSKIFTIWLFTGKVCWPLH